MHHCRPFNGFVYTSCIIILANISSKYITVDVCSNNCWMIAALQQYGIYCRKRIWAMSVGLRALHHQRRHFIRSRKAAMRQYECLTLTDGTLETPQSNSEPNVNDNSRMLFAGNTLQTSEYFPLIRNIFYETTKFLTFGTWQLYVLYLLYPSCQQNCQDISWNTYIYFWLH